MLTAVFLATVIGVSDGDTLLFSSTTSSRSKSGWRRLTHQSGGNHSGRVQSNLFLTSVLASKLK
jgi:hypothetical protein